MDDQNRNLILATALSFAVILVWFLLFPPPEPTTPPETAQTEVQATESGTTTGVAVPSGTGEQAGTPQIAPVETKTRAQALAQTPRVPIETARLSGSLSLVGGRIDDLSLNKYHVTIAKDSPNVTLFTPAGAPEAYYALYGWAPAGGLSYDAVPGPTTRWEVESGTTLSEDNPVTLRWDNGNGLIFRRTISVDDHYMFTMTQSVENTTGDEVRMAPYGIIARHGTPTNLKNFYILHEGVIEMADGELEELKYKKVVDLPVDPGERAAAERRDISSNGWIGFTDHYWMSTLIPDPGQSFTSVTKYTQGNDTFQTDVRLPVMTVGAGTTEQMSTYLFAGPKEWETIRYYQNDLGIDRFVDSIDWGWFFFLTKPIFRALHFLHGVLGNMGLAIICLTLFIKALLFPLAYKSYVSMSKMKKLQPEMERIKEQAGDDRMKMQQEVMALYKREKVNPAAGCLPILLQIPIFFSLYKVIFVTLELRQQPFFGWIHDLSAPDPTSILNLFGLLPFAPPGPGSFLAVFSIGAWPILMGISMWLQMKLNPAPTDKTQAAIFNWMPLIFTFMLGRFASGLVIYWFFNNIITFTQQFIIMRSQGVKPDLLGNMFGRLRKKTKAQ
ncbi:membrane protein insertase YidC [Rhodobacteraceae bacterium DSL-40]|uniref:membrane protein insertase YidC n=1 Tax=Amaricoccus sp. B4 TaxID=3368557 RepID=UPI000DAC101C